MGDIYVHERMKECCRSTLRKLDKAREAGRKASGGSKKATSADGGGSLMKELGDCTSPKATELAQRLHDLHSPLLQIDESAKGKWDEIVAKHCKRHESAGEAREARLWRVLGEPLEVLDLALWPDVNSALADRLNGKNRFSLLQGDKNDEDLLDRLKGLTGHKLDINGHELLLKVGGGAAGPSYWIGSGQWKTLSGEKVWGISFHLFQW